MPASLYPQKCGPDWRQVLGFMQGPFPDFVHGGRAPYLANNALWLVKDFHLPPADLINSPRVVTIS